MEQFRGTTILSVRRGNSVVIGGDGQVSMGNTVMKGNARKVRRLHKDQVLAGFAGGSADAFTLFELFEAQLDKHQGHLVRAAVELAKAWRRIDDKTIEFDLRDDASFHSGNKFTAEDVKYTIEYLKDPKSKMRFADRYNWVKEILVLSPYKIRYVAAEPKSTDMTPASRSARMSPMMSVALPENRRRLPSEATAGTPSPWNWTR